MSYHMIVTITEGLSRAQYWYTSVDVILRHYLFDLASEPVHASSQRIVLKHKHLNNCVSIYNSSGSETFRSPLVLCNDSDDDFDNGNKRQ